MTENVTYCDKHVSSRKCIFFVVFLSRRGERALPLYQLMKKKVVVMMK